MLKKLKIFIYCICFIMIKSVFAMTYSDLRSSLETWESSASRRQIAKDIGVHYSTLDSFMEKKGASSPTVLKHYERYTKQQALLKKEGSCPIDPKKPISRDLGRDFEEIMNYVSEKYQQKIISSQQKELMELKERVRSLSLAPSKIKALKTKINSPKSSHIIIPARGYTDEKDAKGTWYDHFVIQRATHHETRVHVATDQAFPFSALESYIKENPQSLSFGEEREGKKFPLKGELLEESIGLLIIPGRTRNLEYNPVRANHENYLIREALKRGQPILSICAGAWRLWDAYRQLLSDSTYQKTIEEGLKEVEGHVYSRMMSFSNTTGRIVYPKFPIM